MAKTTKVICLICGKESKKHTKQENEICKRKFALYWFSCSKCNHKLARCKCEENKKFLKEFMDMENKVRVDFKKDMIKVEKER